MKQLLVVVTLALALAVTVRGEMNSVTINTNDNPTIEAFVEACSTNGFDTAGFIRQLAASGEICRVLGRHFWRPGRPGEGEGSISGNAWYADYHPGTTYRTCAVCGKPESKSEGAWK